MKRVWFANLFVAGLVGYAVAWICLQYPGGYEALLILVRAGLIALALVVMASFVWWLFFNRKMRVRTLVVSGPLVVGLMAVPLPYYSQSYAVQQNLKQIGVRYRVEPVGFSQTLHQFACDILGLSSSELFASEPTWIEIDPASVRQDQLDRIDNCEHLRAVTVQKRQSDTHLQPELAVWLNRLPESTRIDISFEDSGATDLLHLQKLTHPVGSLSLARHKMTADNICRSVSLAPETVLFYEIDFAKDFNWRANVQPTGKNVSTLHVTRCKLTGSQLLALAQMSGCQSLTCDWLPNALTVTECEMLAQIPGLTSIAFGDMSLTLEHLYPLAASPQLKTFLIGGTPLNNEELMRLRQAFPEGSNRRIRNVEGRVVQTGDVGRRRGG